MSALVVVFFYRRMKEFWYDLFGLVVMGRETPLAHKRTRPTGRTTFAHHTKFIVPVINYYCFYFFFLFGFFVKCARKLHAFFHLKTITEISERKTRKIVYKSFGNGGVCVWAKRRNMTQFICATHSCRQHTTLVCKPSKTSQFTHSRIATRMWRARGDI